MKIIRKKRKGIKIEHNKKLFWVIILLIILLGFLIYFIINSNKNLNEEKICVPATCCHPIECVLSERAPDCSNTFCSAVCSGPLDCNAGHCKLINDKCVIVPNE